MAFARISSTIQGSSNEYASDWGDEMNRSAVLLRRLAGTVVVVLILAGCQTANEGAGSGQLVLSSRTASILEKYLDERRPAALAVTLDGQCGSYRYCPAVVGPCMEENSRYFAIEACESRCNRTCKVLVLGRRVVWDGPVAGLPEELQRPLDPGAIPLVPLPGKPRTTPSGRPDYRGTPIWEAKGCTSPDAKMFDGAPGPEFRDCQECPEMITVPPARYRVGPELYGNRPISEVVFAKPFAVGKYEVTFDEWDACVEDGGCKGYRPKDGGWGRGRQPVINVDWHQAKSYVEWLSAKTGGTYRLLSEAEWEYVARAGSCTTFWWGAETGTGNANCKDCGSAWDGKSPAPVGQFKPNAFGLYDTAGNVSEWVEDCNHSGRPPKDGSALTGDMVSKPKSCSQRQLRGGSWKQRSNEVQPESRELGSPIYPNKFTGFRVAKTLP